MTFGTIQNSFIAGEISPELYGRTDLAKWRNGASTMRNCFANYRGGSSSRAGDAYVGTCKQTGTAAPPRDIPFQFNINQGYALEFGDQYMRIKSDGAYVIEDTNVITAISQTNPGVFTYTNTNYSLSNGDWIYIQNVGGMTNFNGLTWIVTNLSGANFSVTDLFGNTVDTTAFNAYTSGGTLSRIYTVVAPYAAIDLPYLKYTQSADTMSLTCVNTITNTEYPPYDLERFGATNWTFTQVTFNAAIGPPSNVTSVAQSSTTLSTWYSYLVTAVDADTGEESIASLVTDVENNDIAVNAGSNTITWDAVSGASSYKIYKATPSYSVGVPVGSLYGFMGTAFGTQITDTNIQPDFTVVPPIHKDPFARSSISFVDPTAGGTGYTQATIGYTITTSTGSGFVGLPVVVGGAFVAMIIQNAGKGYAPADTIIITDSGAGAGATATLTIGAATGTYPGCVAYFQQRRFYADTLNAPDTYFASKPGLFLNMDSSDPVQDNDAIIGTPWAQQVNGIQFLVPMPGGLVVLTGKGAWQLNGGTAAALTPADQTAAPQAYNGCNDKVPPLVINYDILYIQSKGSIARDLSYNFFANIYTGTDLTVLSNHLFTGHQILQWAWCEEPYKLVWAVREDGIMLSLTYLKEQDVYAWARHDTNGLYVSVCSIIEPPVDALYTITKRYIQNRWVYYSGRMNNRDWENVEDCYCVDSGLQWPMPAPNATLTAQSASGDSVLFNASSSVFTANDVGSVIRMGGGKATITAYNNPMSVTAAITQAITETVPNDPNGMPIPAVSGDWTLTPTTQIVTGLNHLEGMIVAILADGSVVANQVVENGTITLPAAYSAITIGLPFLPQLQTLYLEPPGQPRTVQGKRKDIYSATIRVSSSRGISVGTNQPDSSTEPNNATVPWTNMKEVKERNATMFPGTAIPLKTGDEYLLVPGDWDTKGQVAMQQNYPLPMNVLAVVANYQIGDTDA